MKPERSMAFVGVTDTIALQIRKQIQHVQDRLNHGWNITSADNPDLVFIDPDSDEGKMARGRAKVTGMRFIEVIDGDMDGSDAPTLRMPVEHDTLIELLDSAGTKTVANLGLADQHAADFYDRDLGETNDIHLPDASSPGATVNGAGSPGLEDLVLANELAEGEAHEMRLASHSVVEPRGKRDPSGRPFLEAPDDDSGLQLVAMQAEVLETHRKMHPGGGKRPDWDSATELGFNLDGERDPGHLPLLHFLGEEGPTHPSSHTLDGSPTLYIFPKSREFRVDGDLSSLAAYCTNSLVAGHWQAVTTAHLADIEHLPSRPFSDLIWLYTWLNGDGNLSSRLDPGGSYRLTQTVSIEPGFREHHAITLQMQSSARLHEIAAQSGVPMAQVFDLVNAYAAIDAVDWTRRPPRDAQNDAGDGLLKRLWPFKR